MEVREPAVAGTFYDGAAGKLWSSVEQAFQDKAFGPGKLPSVSLERQGDLLALISPHAGFMYSGPAAAQAYTRLATAGLPETIVLLGPNHQGFGSPYSVFAKGSFKTPLGEVEVDEDLIGHFMVHLPFFEHDPDAHRREHSLEVQLPFIQYLGNSKIKIAPILISTHPFDSSEDGKLDEIADVLAECLETHNALLVISTDLSHYHNINLARQLDRITTRAILTMDGRRLLATVREYEISMCGAIPTAIGLMACESLNAGYAAMLSYYTSGDMPDGDPEKVVGYTSIEICR
ncbi:MAG: AmmeMemoRadiSam system protein B [bacterium]|jgi:AmmeMemoRadiSam system protein B